MDEAVNILNMKFNIPEVVLHDNEMDTNMRGSVLVMAVCFTASMCSPWSMSKWVL